MADPLAVATQRAVSEARLERAAALVGERFGVRLGPRSATPSNRYPDLAAAELVARVADFLESLAKVPHEDQPDRQVDHEAAQAAGAR